MKTLKETGVLVPELLLPGEETDLAKWCCVACDQYTSQPEIWRETEALVGDAPSTLRIILPEPFLSEAETRIPQIHKAMRAYRESVLTRRIHGFMLTARTTQSGCRKGLVLAVDLEQYDFAPDSTSRIRATEGTILSRIPARQKIRQDAALECPHILLLIDDRNRTLIEPLYDAVHTKTPTYDTDLMQGGGHLTGWALSDAALLDFVAQALSALDDARGSAPLFAVGDGNHSLASARANWLRLKPTLSPEEQTTHPARFALCEVVNLYDEALCFAPIHRVLTNVDLDDLVAALEAAQVADGRVAPVEMVSRRRDRILLNLPIEVLQPALDAYLAAHPQVGLDYVHGDEAARRLGSAPGACALLLQTLNKLELFPAVAKGPLPRKAFSMGQAQEKRYYMECRAID